MSRVDTPIIDYIDLKFNNQTNSVSFKFQVNINSVNEEGLYLLNFFNCFESDILNKYSSQTENDVTGAKNSNLSAGSQDDKYFLSEFYVYNGNANFDRKFSINLDVSFMF